MSQPTGVPFANCDGATPDHWATVTANMGLVYRIVNARRWLSPDDHDDAVQNGTFGLLRAAMLYDPERGFAFSTYADAWIRQCIGRGRSREEIRAEARGETFVPPVSLDWPMLQHDGGAESEVAFVDLLVGDDDSGMVLAAEVDELVHHLLAACRDALDLAIVDAVLEHSERPPYSELAEGTGLTREAIRRRWDRLRVRALGECGRDEEAGVPGHGTARRYARGCHCRKCRRAYVDSRPAA